MNVVVMAPALREENNRISPPSIREVNVIDADDTVRGTRLDAALADANVILLGFPVPTVVAAKAPHLAWVHHTQAGVSNLHGCDLWTSDVTLSTSRGVVLPAGCLLCPRRRRLLRPRLA